MTIASPLLFGITGNSVLHGDADVFDLDTRFRMVREAGVFDYYERTPPRGELDAHLPARLRCRPRGCWPSAVTRPSSNSARRHCSK